MMTEVRFHNFKALREVDVTFESRLTVIVGPNGAGKTSLLQGIDIVWSLVHGMALYGQPSELTRFKSTGTGPEGFSILCKCTNEENKPFSLLINSDLSVAKNNTSSIHDAVKDHNNNRHMFSIVKGWLNFQRQPAPQPPKESRYTAVFLRFDQSALASPATMSKIPQTVAPNGASLAPTLAYMVLKEPEQFALIVQAFRKVIPNVERIRFEKAAGNFADMILFDFKGAKEVPAAYASTGTLHTLGLLAVILGPERPDIILIDDIDHALHPKAQVELIKVLRKLLEQFPKLQIIATSHSLYILHELKANEVRVMAVDPVDGRTACAPLTDHPDYERWKETMSPGEFWSHVGEDWVLDAKNKKGLEPITP